MRGGAREPGGEAEDEEGRQVELYGSAEDFACVEMHSQVCQPGRYEGPVLGRFEGGEEV